MSKETQAAPQDVGQEQENEPTPEGGEEKRQASNVQDLPEWARSLIGDLRKEAAGHRKAKQEAAKAAQEAEEKRLAEQEEWRQLAEKRQERVAELERQAEEMAREARENVIRAAFVNEAAKLGALHPQDAYALADLSTIDVGDDGTVVGVEEAVQKIVDDGRLPVSGKQPAPSLDGGAGDGKRHNAQPLTAEEIEAARKMGLTAEQYQAAKAKAQKK